MRHGAARVSREAAPDPALVQRLGAARLYVITPDREPSDIFDVASAAVGGGAEVLQLRHKTLARGELLHLAERLRGLTAGAHVLFVVNDHIDIALMAGADGVHLGPDDLSVASARRVAADRLLIGASASTPAAAAAAVADGADYIGCGPAFATPVKQEKEVIGPDGVARVVAAVSVPVFAIGGIDESNVGRLTALGLRRVCVIRAVAGAADPRQAARRLRAMLGD